MKCVTCGQKVSIYSTNEGTNSYVGEGRKDAVEEIIDILNNNRNKTIDEFIKEIKAQFNLEG